MAFKRLLSFAVVLLTLINVVHGAKKGKFEMSLEAVEAEAAVAAKDSALMGKLFPLFSKLFNRKGELSFRQVVTAVIRGPGAADQREFAIFATVGWGLVPVTQSFYEVYANVTGRGLVGDDDDDEGAEAVHTTTRAKLKEAFQGITLQGKARVAGEVAKQQNRKMSPFEETYLYQIVTHISQASKIGFSVIVVDCVSLISRMMGYNPWNIMEHASRIFSKVAYTGWITFRLKIMKRYFLERALGKMVEGEDLGKLNVIDNLADGIVYLGWMFYILNYLEVQTGVAVKVFGLASKDIASQLMSGLTLHLSDKIFEGDDVRFSDGTSGKIEKMGWFETMIRNSDELVVGIPNTQLSGQRVYNLSRTPRSQVKQELRVSYDDVAKIPKLLTSIKEEIQKDCPKLITDGSRPFRAHWRNYEDDHLQIVVDCHFLLKPTGGEYWDNRQKVLEAIFRAAKAAGVKFQTLVRV
ncbi:hypothetical protein ACHAXR_013587 [Thalassiosira sp. AJA248-18]